MKKWVNRYKINLKVAVLCIVSAATFWFLKAMNKDYSYTVSVPITFSYPAEKYIEIDRVPTTLKTNSTGYGWNLMAKMLGIGIDDYVVDLTKFKFPLTIPTSIIISEVQEQVEGVQINFSLQDSLYTGIDLRDEKQIQLVLDVSSLPDSIRIEKQQLSADRITVLGPQKELEKLPSKFVITLEQLKKGESVVEEVVKLPITNEVKYSPEVIKATVLLRNQQIDTLSENE